ncbi:hypothetical protein [Suttonella ornithocola]|nr:hypothetical protein [Suttonella ornithocola]
MKVVLNYMRAEVMVMRQEAKLKIRVMQIKILLALLQNKKVLA